MGDSSPMVKEERDRVCDFCGESIALLYCRADSAKLCLSCDRQVHSTNQLFTKHGRSLLCDACDSSPASIFCTTHNSVLCQNCDWESHGLSLSSLHDRRPLEAFTGCPSVTELLAIAGFEDVGKKELFGDGLVDSDPYGSDDGFSDFLVWDTPSFVSLDDLIVSGGSDHQFQAMGVPPLPKNRNAACGQHKEELFDQLREMAKLEPNMNDGQGDVEQPLLEFHSLVPEHNIQLQDTSGFEDDTKPTLIPSYEANEHQWCSDPGEAADKDLSSTLLGSYIDTNCLVPDKDSDIGNSLSHANGGHEQQSWRDVVTETLQVPKFAARELTSQDRDTAISRYKEKKKTRRYDKHIRYESRKVRAESRTRIRGRFAKMDH